MRNFSNVKWALRIEWQSVLIRDALRMFVELAYFAKYGLLDEISFGPIRCFEVQTGYQWTLSSRCDVKWFSCPTIIECQLLLSNRMMRLGLGGVKRRR